MILYNTATYCCITCVGLLTRSFLWTEWGLHFHWCSVQSPGCYWCRGPTSSWWQLGRGYQGLGKLTGYQNNLHEHCVANRKRYCAFTYVVLCLFETNQACSPVIGYQAPLCPILLEQATAANTQHCPYRTGWQACVFHLRRISTQPLQNMGLTPPS